MILDARQPPVLVQRTLKSAGRKSYEGRKFSDGSKDKIAVAPWRRRSALFLPRSYESRLREESARTEVAHGQGPQQPDFLGDLRTTSTGGVGKRLPPNPFPIA